MSERTLFKFPYISLDGTLLSAENVTYFKPELLQVRGEITRTVFDTYKKKPIKMKGFYVQYQGKEYGSISVTLADYQAFLSNCGCPEDAGKIHVFQFANEFV